MIFAISLTYFLEKVNIPKKGIISISLILYFIGCLGCAYANLFNNIPDIVIVFKSNYFNIARRILLMAFPFFINGYWTFFIKNGSKLVKSLFLLIIAYFLEIYLVCKFALQLNITITLILYPLLINVFLLLLTFKLSDKSALAFKCRSLANFTYYSHPMFIIFIKLCSKHIFACKIPQTMMFALVCLFTIIAGLSIDYFKARFLLKKK